MYTYNYGIDHRGHFFEVFLDGHFWAEISSAAKWESTKAGQIKLVDIPFPQEAQNVVENWFKFVQVPKKAAGQFRKALGYTKASFDAVRSKFGAHREGTDSHATPPEVLEFVRLFGSIALDPFGMKGSYVKAQFEYYYPENDGFKDPWVNFLNEKGVEGNIFVNHPFSEADKLAAKWAVEYRELMFYNWPRVMFCVIPNTKSEQSWYHEMMRHTDYIYYFRGRTSYHQLEEGVLKPQTSPGFPSALLIADPLKNFHILVNSLSLKDADLHLNKRGTLISTKNL